MTESKSSKPFNIFDLYTPEYVEEIREAHLFLERFQKDQEEHPMDPDEKARQTREMLDDLFKVFESMGASPSQPLEETPQSQTPRKLPSPSE